MSLYRSYYLKQLEEGEEFQDFVVYALQTRGLSIPVFTAKRNQLKFGESRAGVEIKYDKNHTRTSNFYIEVAEKADPAHRHYVPSGIYRPGQTEYIIGDRDLFMRLPTNVLLKFHQTGQFKEIENKFKTSIGFLLPREKAKSIAIAAYAFNMEKKYCALMQQEAGTKNRAAIITQILTGDPKQEDLFGGVKF